MVGRTYNRFLRAPYKQAAKRFDKTDVHFETLITNGFFQASKLSLLKFNDDHHQNFDEQSGNMEGRKDSSSSYTYKASNPPQRRGHVSLTWSCVNKVHEACCLVFDSGAFVGKRGYNLQKHSQEKKKTTTVAVILQGQTGDMRKINSTPGLHNHRKAPSHV